MVKKIAFVVVVALLAAFAMVKVVGGAPPDSGPRVTICHGTNSVTNPYEVRTVDPNSVSASGHAGHTGPVATSQAVAQVLKDAHINWGDIIPPTAGFPSGLNYAAGQSIVDDGCLVPATEPTATPTPTTPTEVPTSTPTSTPTPTATPTSTPEPTVGPSSTPTPTPTDVPSPTPTATPEPTATPTPTPTCEENESCSTPTPTPTGTPTSTPTPTSTIPPATPTPEPTDTPTDTPTSTPTPTTATPTPTLIFSPTTTPPTGTAWSTTPSPGSPAVFPDTGGAGPSPRSDISGIPIILIAVGIASAFAALLFIVTFVVMEGLDRRNGAERSWYDEEFDDQRDPYMGVWREPEGRLDPPPTTPMIRREEIPLEEGRLVSRLVDIGGPVFFLLGMGTLVAGVVVQVFF